MWVYICKGNEDIETTQSLGEARLILDPLLNPEKNRRLPVVELGDLVEFEYSTSESFNVSGVNSLDDRVCKLAFTC